MVFCFAPWFTSVTVFSGAKKGAASGTARAGSAALGCRLFDASALYSRDWKKFSKIFLGYQALFVGGRSG
jgi:hypothetical protein